MRGNYAQRKRPRKLHRGLIKITLIDEFIWDVHRSLHPPFPCTAAAYDATVFTHHHTWSRVIFISIETNYSKELFILLTFKEKLFIWLSTQQPNKYFYLFVFHEYF